MELTNNGEAVVLHEKGGKTTKLDNLQFSTFMAGLAGSEDGAAWWTGENSTMSYVDAEGKVSRIKINGLGGDSITAMAAGGGTVALRHRPGPGRLLEARHQRASARSARCPAPCSSWRRTATTSWPSTATSRPTPSAPTAARPTSATSGSRSAPPLNADYAVFPVAVDALPGGVSEAIGGRMPDTDLYLYSFATNKIYSPLEERGQQGFPSISGDRLVWQDGVFGGDDIMEVRLPSGL